LKQQPGRLKSAVVNTATADLAGGVHVTDAGAGKLNAADAVNVAATLEPAAISFGPVPTVLPVNRTLTLTNVSGAAATFSLAVRQLSSDSNARVTVSQSNVNLPAGGHQDVTVSLTGSKPAPGAYEGFIDVTGSGPALHLPYFYVVGDGIPYDIFPMLDGGFVAPPNDYGWRIALRVVDQYGAPVAKTLVTFRIQSGGGKFDAQIGDAVTDVLGNAGTWVDVGASGDQIFTGTAGVLTQEFYATIRRYPTINGGGVINAAPPYLAQTQAPGSYISIFGSDLADASLVETTQSLPVSLGLVSVSFDGGGKSLPGHIHFVSPGQINVQIPWEFQGQPSVQMKVTLFPYWYIWGSLYTVPLATYSPGIFAVTDGVSGAVISASNPVKRSGSIVIWANGLGPVSVAQSSGDPASSTLPLASTNTTPTVTIGGSPTGFYFSGLTPGSVGLYQVNVTIPADAPTGTQPLKLSIGGQDATVNVVVQ
jgi:uncharacterized protein (TIGR03437 family)